jgi:hypothetical protein
MDSSFGKNAANRVEESYGDAKNLSLRHPQAAIGFLYGLRSTAFDDEPETAAWLIELLGKLGREDDAYDAVGLVIMEYSGPPDANLGDEPEEPAPLNIEPAVGDSDVNEEPLLDLDDHLDALPTVRLLPDLVPGELTPARFFDVIVRTVLANSPITFHRQARAKFAYPRSS